MHFAMNISGLHPADVFGLGKITATCTIFGGGKMIVIAVVPAEHVLNFGREIARLPPACLKQRLSLQYTGSRKQGKC